MQHCAQNAVRITSVNLIYYRPTTLDIQNT